MLGPAFCSVANALDVDDARHVRTELGPRIATVAAADKVTVAQGGVDALGLRFVDGQAHRHVLAEFGQAILQPGPRVAAVLAADDQPLSSGRSFPQSLVAFG